MRAEEFAFNAQRLAQALSFYRRWRRSCTRIMSGDQTVNRQAFLALRLGRTHIMYKSEVESCAWECEGML